MRVFIVQKGEWGKVKRERGDYGPYERTLEIILASRLGKDSVVCVPATESALRNIESRRAQDAVIVYTTRGMFQEAQDLKAKHPGLRVVVLSGLVDDLETNKEGVVVVDKGITDPANLAAAILWRTPPPKAS